VGGGRRGGGLGGRMEGVIRGMVHVPGMCVCVYMYVYDGDLMSA
jgi:hypothetical protein